LISPNSESLESPNEHVDVPEESFDHPNVRQEKLLSFDLPVEQRIVTFLGVEKWEPALLRVLPSTTTVLKNKRGEWYEYFDLNDVLSARVLSLDDERPYCIGVQLKRKLKGPANRKCMVVFNCPLGNDDRIFLLRVFSGRGLF